MGAIDSTNNIKIGKGSAEIKRFFYLAGLILDDNATSEEKEEFKELDKEYKILNLLSGLNVSYDLVQKNYKPKNRACSGQTARSGKVYLSFSEIKSNLEVNGCVAFFVGSEFIILAGENCVEDNANKSAYCKTGKADCYGTDGNLDCAGIVNAD